MRRYAYDGDDLVAEMDGGNNTLARYSYSGVQTDDILSADVSSAGVAAGLAPASGRFYFLKDSSGSITEIVNSSGTIMQQYSYNAFGKVSSVLDGSGANVTGSAPIKTAFAFIGRELDAETGFYYVRARYYDPSIGRFMQEDPNPGVMSSPLSMVNKYIYAHNSPTRFKDPRGRDIWDEIGKGISVIAGAIVAVYTGAFIAASLGLSGIAGAAVGALGGALTGGITTAIGYSYSHSDPYDGFRIGAAIGLFAGMAGGYYGSQLVKAGLQVIKPSDVFREIKGSLNLFNGAPQAIESALHYWPAASGWSIWTTIADVANIVLPYAVVGAEVYGVAFAESCIRQDTCSAHLPKEYKKNLIDEKW